MRLQTDLLVEPDMHNVKLLTHMVLHQLTPDFLQCAAHATLINWKEKSPIYLHESNCGYNHHNVSFPLFCLMLSLTPNHILQISVIVWNSRENLFVVCRHIKKSIMKSVIGSSIYIMWVHWSGRVTLFIQHATRMLLVVCVLSGSTTFFDIIS